MIVYHHIRQLIVQEFFQKRSDFPGKGQKLEFFFTVLPKQITIKSLFHYRSVGG